MVIIVRISDIEFPYYGLINKKVGAFVSTDISLLSHFLKICFLPLLSYSLVTTQEHIFLLSFLRIYFIINLMKLTSNFS
jgi:hypothetical protein